MQKFKQNKQSSFDTEAEGGNPNLDYRASEPSYIEEELFISKLDNPYNFLISYPVGLIAELNENMIYQVKSYPLKEDICTIDVSRCFKIGLKNVQLAPDARVYFFKNDDCNCLYYFERKLPVALYE